MADQSRQNGVWIVGPESRVYHIDTDCPALNNTNRYYPARRATLNPDGTITSSWGHTHKGRTLCKRCGPVPVGASDESTPRGQSEAPGV